MSITNRIFEFFNLPINQDIVIYEILIITLLALFANLVLLFALNRLAIQAAKTATSYDDILIKAIKKPASWLIWAIGISFAIELMVDDQTNLAVYAPMIRSISFVVLTSWFLITFISTSEPVVIKSAKDKESSIDHTTYLAISRLLKVSVLIIAGLMILQNLGLSISAVLAFGGVGGIAVGFAARDLLANFFGGLMIFLDKPFSLDDWIRSPDRNIEGTVEKINWRLCVIRTFDQRPLYIPNAIFNSIVIENPSRMTNRRINETIGLRYQDASKMPVIVKEVEEMLRNHPDIDTTQILMVNFNQFATSSLDFFIYTFTKTTVWTEFHHIKQDVLFKIIAIIDSHGAEIAFPSRTLFIESENEKIQEAIEQKDRN